MNWPEAIALIDQLHVEYEPPPAEVRERSKSLAEKWQDDGVSPPGKVEMSPPGDIDFRWKFPGRDVLCCLWSDGCGDWYVFAGECVVTSWPVEG